MEVKSMTVNGLCIGVSPLEDFESKQVIGVKLELGARNANGKFNVQTLKIADKLAQDLEAYLDTSLTVTLEDCSISAYQSGNRSALSIKANYSAID